MTELWWCRVCDALTMWPMSDAHVDPGCLGWFDPVSEEMAKDFFRRMEELAR